MDTLGWEKLDVNQGMGQKSCGIKRHGHMAEGEGGSGESIQSMATNITERV